MSGEPSTSKENTDGDAGETSPKAAKKPVLQLIYPAQSKSDDILRSLTQQRHDGEFCDIQLKLSDTKTVYAHKCILALSSPYFEGMFSSAFIESTSDVVDLSGVGEGSETFEKVINTFYGGQFEINKDNVYEALNFGAMLFLDEMKADCARVLEANLSIYNSAEMLTLAVNFDLKALQTKIKPFLISRFHDYIMFQEELLELSPDGFEFLLSCINTKFIARKGDFIKFILKWFTTSESDERAKLLIKAILQTKFKINKRAYDEFEDDLEDVLNHLDDMNSDVSDDMKTEIRKSLPSLKPVGYIKNRSPKYVNESHIEDRMLTPVSALSDSELEDEPIREMSDLGYIVREYGPPTKKKGFTEEEERMWKRHHEEMAERDKHRKWAVEWPLTSLTKRDTNPLRPKKIRREPHAKPHKTRKFRVKTKLELLEAPRLVTSLILLAPSAIGGQIVGDTFDIVAFIPRKSAWYKISTLRTTSINEAFPNPPGSSDPEAPVPDMDEAEVREMMRGGRGKPDRRNIGMMDSDDEDEEMYHYGMMMDMHGPDMPELMMMMRHMPSSRRRRFMEDAMRGRLPSAMMRRMMEMDMDEEDMPRHEYMMMREMARMNRHRGMHGAPQRRKTVPSLGDPKWQFVYFRHRLYFYHQELVDSVFCYDIASDSWARSGLTVDNPNPERQKPEFPEGIDLLLLGRTLYAIVRIAQLDLEHEHRTYYRPYSDEEVERERSVYVRYKIFKMEGEFSTAKWELVITTDVRVTHIPNEDNLGKEKKTTGNKEEDKRKRERRKHMMHYAHMMESQQSTIVPGCFKTVCCVADDEQFYIFTAVKDRDNKFGTKCHTLRLGEVVTLDLMESRDVSVRMYASSYTRTLTPVYHNDLTVFINDDLDGAATVDHGTPLDIFVTDRLAGGIRAEQQNEFLEALKKYPYCNAVNAGDGLSMFVLRGTPDNHSELSELTATVFYPRKDYMINTTKHPAPPYKSFAMVDAGKMDMLVIQTLGRPMKYQHDE